MKDWEKYIEDRQLKKEALNQHIDYAEYFRNCVATTFDVSAKLLIIPTPMGLSILRNL